jgi:hypothetical protein
MKTLSKLVSTSSVSLLVITSPVLISGSHKKIDPASTINTTAISASNTFTSTLSNKAANFKPVNYVGGNDAVTDKKIDYATNLAAAKAFEVKMVIREASMMYYDMNLKKSGLNQKAFEYAWRGYHNLVKKGTLNKTNVLSICDFTQSSKRKRLYIIDVLHKKLLINTYVSHGMNSGVEYATSFSNQAESFKTSLGFYVTKKAYLGRNGLSLRIAGLEKGYNDLASKRNIVIHGADYIGTDYLKANGEMGRSLGCTAVPKPINNKVIRTIKNGSAWFIYYPAKKYLNDSAVING